MHRAGLVQPHALCPVVEGAGHKDFFRGVFPASKPTLVTTPLLNGLDDIVVNRVSWEWSAGPETIGCHCATSKTPMAAWKTYHLKL